MTPERKRHIEEFALFVAFLILLWWLWWSNQPSETAAPTQSAAPSVGGDTLGGETINNAAPYIGAGNGGSIYLDGSPLTNPGLDDGSTPFRIVGPPNTGGDDCGCNTSPACSIGSQPTPATLQKVGTAYNAALAQAIANTQQIISDTDLDTSAKLNDVLLNWAAYDNTEAAGVQE